MNRTRAGLAASAAVASALAVVVHLAGAQLAGRTCIEDGVDLLVPEQRLTAEPEGYGVDIPRAGVCRVTHRGEVYRQVPLSTWDLAEPAAALGALGVVLAGAWLVATWQERRER